MNLKERFMRMDPTYKLAVVLLLFAITYAGTLIIMDYSSDPTIDLRNPRRLPGMRGMLAENQNEDNSNMAMLLAAAVGLASLFIAIQPSEGKGREKKVEKRRSANGNRHYRQIINRLSKDEKIIVERLKHTGEITQDSLRSQLGWSKAKVSTVLGVMERQGFIKKNRKGKTYLVKLSKKLYGMV